MTWLNMKPITSVHTHGALCGDMKLTKLKKLLTTNLRPLLFKIIMSYFLKWRVSNGLIALCISIA